MKTIPTISDTAQQRTTFDFFPDIFQKRVYKLTTLMIKTITFNLTTTNN